MSAGRHVHPRETTHGSTAGRAKRSIQAALAAVLVALALPSAGVLIAELALTVHGVVFGDIEVLAAVP